MMIKHLPLLAVALIVPLTAGAQATKQIPLPPSQNPRNADLPISAAVWAGDLLFVSGWLDPGRKTMMAGYSQFFGTKDQPNKPARTTVEVVLPAAGSGALVEIDVVAVRPK